MAADAAALEDVINADHLKEFGAGDTLAAVADLLASVPGLAWTGLIDGRIAGCGGLIFIAGLPGCAAAWGVAAGWADEHLLEMLRVFRRLMDATAAEYALRRVQMTLLTDQPTDWAMELGFAAESKCCVAGHDAVLWVKNYLPSEQFHRNKSYNVN
jgi:hypothetical protein